MAHMQTFNEGIKFQGWYDSWEIWLFFFFAKLYSGRRDVGAHVTTDFVRAAVQPHTWAVAETLKLTRWRVSYTQKQFRHGFRQINVRASPCLKSSWTLDALDPTLARQGCPQKGSSKQAITKSSIRIENVLNSLEMDGRRKNVRYCSIARITQSPVVPIVSDRLFAVNEKQKHLVALSYRNQIKTLPVNV